MLSTTLRIYHDIAIYCTDPTNFLGPNQRFAGGPSIGNQISSGTVIQIECTAGYIWNSTGASQTFFCTNGNWTVDVSSCLGIFSLSDTKIKRDDRV